MLPGFLHHTRQGRHSCCSDLIFLDVLFLTHEKALTGDRVRTNSVLNSRLRGFYFGPESCNSEKKEGRGLQKVQNMDKINLIKQMIV